MHCPENNMNLRKKNKPVTAEADEMAYLLLDTYCTVLYSVHMLRISGTETRHLRV